MKKVSIIIPTRNEEKNIVPLLERIHNALFDKKIPYEVIFIDDHSTDKTFEKINSIKNLYPIKVYLKKGQRGKAQSILEGVSYAKYDLLCMIDADLQYSPEAIPHMVEKIGSHADIIVANRHKRNVGFHRKLASFVFVTVFGKFLHGLDYDVQSGLKVFRKEILQRIVLHPTAWTFDMEFLLKARMAGYKIESFDIVFHKRKYGKSKVGILKATLEISASAIKLKLMTPEIIPFHPSIAKQKGNGFHYKGAEFVHYTDLQLKDSAMTRLTFLQKMFLILGTEVIVLGLITNWHLTVTIAIAGLTILYFTDLLFNLFLIYRSFSKEPEINISASEIAKIAEDQLPTYTIMCPLYKEWQVLPQFMKAIHNLDYPKHKLQVLLLLEQDDKETIEKVQQFALPKYYQIAVIPHSIPKTKPKALNFGLTQTTGEYAVVYDAEDIPNPQQLKKAVLAFKKLPRKTVCVQAKLNFYNPHQNLLTRLFTAEYSLWFDLVLTGLQSIQAPIPLGGTSNHFRTADLIKLRGWDPFNVTEDADLGMRIVKQGYATAVVNSDTMEEANSDFPNWIKQRSRWIKGYMQTYLVHMRRPQEFIREWHNPNLLTFQLIVGGKILSMLVNPLMWMTTISYFAFRLTLGPFIESFFPTPIFYMAAISLVAGNFLYSYYYMLGAAKRNQWQLIPYTLITPFYWLAMSAAAGFALFEFIVRPFYWQKTKHGLHLQNKVEKVPSVQQKISVVPAT